MENTKENIITKEEAAARGLVALTTGYRRNEKWMLDNVVADMNRGNIDHALVKGWDGVEVWRSRHTPQQA